MAQKRLGKATVALAKPAVDPRVRVGRRQKGGRRPLSKYYDEILTDDLYDEKTWEKAESKLQKSAIQRAIAKANHPDQRGRLCVCGRPVKPVRRLALCAQGHTNPILWPLWGLFYYGGKHLSRGNGN